MRLPLCIVLWGHLLRLTSCRVSWISTREDAASQHRKVKDQYETFDFSKLFRQPGSPTPPPSPFTVPRTGGSVRQYEPSGDIVDSPAPSIANTPETSIESTPQYEGYWYSYVSSKKSKSKSNTSKRYGSKSSKVEGKSGKKSHGKGGEKSKSKSSKGVSSFTKSSKSTKSEIFSSEAEELYEQPPEGKRGKGGSKERPGFFGSSGTDAPTSAQHMPSSMPINSPATLSPSRTQEEEMDSTGSPVVSIDTAIPTTAVPNNATSTPTSVLPVEISAPTTSPVVTTTEAPLGPSTSSPTDGALLVDTTAPTVSTTAAATGAPTATVTTANTDPPAVTAATASPVAPVADGNSRATPFCINFMVEGIPVEDDVVAANVVTCQHLANFVAARFDENVDIAYDSFACMSSSFNTMVAARPQICFEFEAIILPSSSYTPTATDMDALVQVSLLPPTVDLLLTDLANNLPPENPFSATTSVQQIMLSDSVRSSSAASNSSILVSSFVLVSALVGISVHSLHKHTQKQKRQAVEGGEKECDEIVDFYHDEEQRWMLAAPSSSERSRNRNRNLHDVRGRHASAVVGADPLAPPLR